MKKTIIASSLALALIGSSFVYAQSFDKNTSVVSSTVNTTTDIVDSISVGCNPPTRSLRMGDGNRNLRKEEVKKLQAILIKQEHLLGTATGYFGSQTFAAVKKFQIKEGVSPTGYVGVLTLDRLKARCGIGPIATCDYAAPPSGCYYTPGPGFDKRTSCGLVLECGDSGAYTPPANCSSWYDGCNTCSRVSPKGKEFCTKMACISPNDGSSVTANARCNAYFNTDATCNALGKTYTEGQSTDCIDTGNGQVACIADATHVCRSGTWKIEGGLPPIKPFYPIKPIEPIYCSMEARLCAGGAMMPRDNNCIWHPEQCSN